MRDLVRLAEERESRAKAAMGRLLESRSSVLQGPAEVVDDLVAGMAPPLARAWQLCACPLDCPTRNNLAAKGKCGVGDESSLPFHCYEPVTAWAKHFRVCCTFTA